jgi:hypothetical protein
MNSMRPEIQRLLGLRRQPVSGRGERHSVRTVRRVDGSDESPERRDGDHVAQTEDRKRAEFVRDHLPTLRGRLAPLRVIAFGSRVRGDALSTSDLDLILVSP